MEKITLWEAMETRHSVRSYTDRKIEGEVKEKFLTAVKRCNHESGLHMQLVLDEPKAFSGFMAHYGKFSGVRNYIAVVGKKGPELDETCGYYGERLVLFAQRLGLIFFSLDGDQVSAKAGRGFYTKLDLGIVKYHFTIGAGNQNFMWA
ncbi:MAG: nitroreductase family protein [Lachnospiraceae bacterium]|nr:nitroreductase family protein [Lachnospiraceae bacterium]